MNKSSLLNQNENDLGHTIKQYLNRFQKTFINSPESKSTKRDINLLHRRLFNGLTLICHKYSNVHLHYSFDVFLFIYLYIYCIFLLKILYHLIEKNRCSHRKMFELK